MEVSTVVLWFENGINVLLALVLLLVICRLLARRGNRRLPPGPFAWPVIGNIRMFRKDPCGFKKFTELAKTYGNVYRYIPTRHVLQIIQCDFFFVRLLTRLYIMEGKMLDNGNLF